MTYINCIFLKLQQYNCKIFSNAVTLRASKAWKEYREDVGTSYNLIFLP